MRRQLRNSVRAATSIPRLPRGRPLPAREAPRLLHLAFSKLVEIAFLAVGSSPEKNLVLTTLLPRSFASLRPVRPTLLSPTRPSTTAALAGSGIEAIVDGLVVQSNGDIVVVGYQITFSQSRTATVNGLARLTPSETLDTTFGSGETVVNTVPPVRRN